MNKCNSGIRKDNKVIIFLIEYRQWIAGSYYTDERNIAVLARAFNNLPYTFVKPN